MKNFPNWRFSEKDLERVKQVLTRNFSASKPTTFCKQLEQLWAKKVKAKFALACSSGTATLHTCLASVGVKKGDEVIVPALGPIMTANVVIFQNAIPIFADVDENTFNIDPKDIKKKITNRTKAIIPISLYGLPCEMNKILKIGAKYDLEIIEDNAETPIKSIANMTSYSFESTKHFASGEGGIITTNNEILANKARAFLNHGYRSVNAKQGEARVSRDEFQDPDYKRHSSFGWAYRIPEIACAILISQVERYNEIIKLRQEIAKLYAEVVDNCDFMTSQHVPQGYKNVYWTYAVKFEGNKDKWRRFRKAYMKNGGDGIYACWSLVYDEPVYKKRLFASRIRPINLKQPCPIAEKIQPKIMQFCTNYGSKAEALPKVEALRKTIKEFEI